MPPSSPGPEGSSSSPFGPSEGQPASPFSPGAGPPGAENPYESPTQSGQPPQYPYPPGGYVGPSPAERVAGPAIALIVTAVLALVTHIGLAFFCLVMLNAPQRPPEVPFSFRPEITLVQVTVALIMAIIILLGAIKMKNLESYGFSMTAAILAMIPCTWPCCLLGLPFGIWALVVLSNDQVKAAFRG